MSIFERLDGAKLRAKPRFLTAGVLVVAVGIPSAVAARELRYALGFSSTFTTFPAIERFAAQVTRDTGLEMKVYAQSLLNPVETMAGLRDGIADVGWETFQYHPAEYSESNLIAEMNMLTTIGNAPPIPGAAMAGAALEYNMLNCPECLDQHKAQNQVYTAGMGSAPYDLICMESITTVEQLQGKRIRAGGGSYSRWAAHFGATGVSMPGNEAYDAMSQGVLDCTANDIGQMLGSRYIDVAKAVTLGVPGGVYGGTASASFNRDVWQSLTTEQRIAILHASARLTADNTLAFYAAIGDARKATEEKGIPIIEASDEMKAATAAFVDTDMTAIEKQFTESYGMQNTAAKMATARELIEKWKDLTQAIALDDVDSLEKLYWDEVYSKLDPETYGMN